MLRRETGRDERAEARDGRAHRPDERERDNENDRLPSRRADHHDGHEDEDVDGPNEHVGEGLERDCKCKVWARQRLLAALAADDDGDRPREVDKRILCDKAREHERAPKELEQERGRAHEEDEATQLAHLRHMRALVSVRDM